MKRFIIGFSFLTFLTTVLYSQEISEKEGIKVLKQIRKEIQKEERQKEKATKEAEKIERKKGKKIIKEIERDMNESLEEKVFRSKNIPEARIAAAEEAFKTGRERMAFLREEEKEILNLEKSLGIVTNENRDFLGDKFDKVYEKFKENNNEIEILLMENRKLNEYLDRLNKMEEKVKERN